MIIRENIGWAMKNVYIPAIPTNDVECAEYFNIVNATGFDGALYIASAKFNNRLKVCAGTADSVGNIRMNRHIQHPVEFLSTAIHEASHIRDYQLHGCSGHGKPWQRIFQDAINKWGLETLIIPSRFHDYKELSTKSKPRAKKRFFCTTEDCSMHDVPLRATKRQREYMFRTGGVAKCHKCQVQLTERIIY